MTDKISVVVPCYNEEQSIKLFYDALKSAVVGMQTEFEIIFVDDGSADGTISEMQNLAAQDCTVLYISFSRNFGKEAAIYAGLEHATGDYVVLMDVDLQDPPSLIPQMYGILKAEAYDCVATRRTTRKNEPVMRSLFAHGFYKLFHRMTGLSVMDGARDFRMMTKDMTESILKLGEQNRFSKGIFTWVGYRTKWLDYENIARKTGETKWSFKKLLFYALDGVVAFSEKAMYLPGTIGLFFLFSLFLLSIILATYTLFNHTVPTTWWLALGVCFLFGITFTFIGVLGVYIAKIAQEIKGRPLYIIRHSNVNHNEKGKEDESEQAV